MTITVGIIGPEGRAREQAAFAIGCIPHMFVSATTTTLADFRGRYKETRPMVVLLGIGHLEPRGEGKGAFWSGIQWCQRHFPSAPIAVWFESADAQAPQDLHDVGVLGIVQAEDANDELWTKLVSSVYNGATLWSRPFKIEARTAQRKKATP